MSTSQRIKGLEVNILITSGGDLQDTITDIQEFSFEDMLEIISKGYLGEPSERKDEIYKGVKFDMGLHIHDQAWFTFRLAIVNRAQRITPNTKFNITGVLAMPNGQTPKFVIPDAKFGALPVKVSSRNEYVDFKLSGETEQMIVTLS
jgi:hypothetical protein